MRENLRIESNPDFSVFLQAEAKRYKKACRKIIAIIVVICLFFGLLGFMIGRASAFNVPSDMVNLDYFYNRLILAPGSNTASIDECLSHLTSESSVVMSWYESSERTTWCLFISDHGLLEIYNGVWGCSDSDATLYYGYFDTWGTISPQSASCTNFVMNTHGDIDFYSCPISGNFYLYSAYSLYFNNIFYIDLMTYYPPNLEYGSFVDSRILECYKQSINSVDYIFVRTSDNPNNRLSIRFDYTDALGSFSKTFLADELNPSGPSFYYIDPNLISEYLFTINSCTYTSSGSYGSKTVSGLSLSFNSVPFPLQPGYNTTNYITNFSQTLAGAGWVTGLTTLYGGYRSIAPAGSYVWDIEFSAVQPFGCRILYLPNFLFDSGGLDFANFSIQDYYTLFEQYDCIIAGLGDTFFDYIYGSGSYDSVHNSYRVYGIDYALNHIMSLEESAHILPYQYKDESLTIVYTDQSTGILYNRTFILKQILYAMGDVDSRLLEFETNLVGEDGVLKTIQDKWITQYESDNIFHNDLFGKLEDVIYAINGLDFGSLDGILSRLDRIIGYLDFDIDFDINDLAHPWIDFFEYGKNLLDDSMDYLDEFSDSVGVLNNGYLIPENYPTDVALPVISGTPVPLPVVPTSTPIPISSGG